MPDSYYDRIYRPAEISNRLPRTDERTARLAVRAGYRTDALVAASDVDVPFALSWRAIIAGVAGPTLRPYRVTLMQGARGRHTWSCFTWAGARRLQRRVLDRALARDRQLDAQILEAARRAGKAA